MCDLMFQFLEHLQGALTVSPCILRTDDSSDVKENNQHCFDAKLAHARYFGQQMIPCALTQSKNRSARGELRPVAFERTTLSNQSVRAPMDSHVTITFMFHPEGPLTNLSFYSGYYYSVIIYLVLNYL